MTKDWAEPFDAVVAGHICLDVIPDLSVRPEFRLDALLRPGHLVEIGPAAFSTGGSVSNTGLALHRLGIRTLLMGKVGNDLFGQEVRQIVASYGSHLADGMVIDEQVSMRRMYENGGRQLAELERRAKETGVTTSLDMAFVDPASEAGRADWASILKSTLPYVDIFMPSIEEILFMLRRETYDQFYRASARVGFLSLVTPQLLSDLGRSRTVVALFPGEGGRHDRLGRCDDCGIPQRAFARPGA